MIRKIGYIAIHLILIAPFITSTAVHGMHFVKRAHAIKKYRPATKTVVRHLRCSKYPGYDDTMCKRILLAADLHTFSKELKDCCRSISLARPLMWNLISQGHSAKTEVVLRHYPDLFDESEINAFKRTVQFKYDRFQKSEHAEILGQLKHYKPRTHSTSTISGCSGSNGSNSKSTKTHGNNSNCCCDWK